eukprot:scaffold4127_cov126-Cylindrotheca_fusiformis.AAC.9
MFAIRKASTHQSIKRIAIQHQPVWRTTRISPSSDAFSFFSTSAPADDDDDDYFLGSVKFFIRNKSYGFIIPDDPASAGASEIWVHRTSIDSPNHSSDEYPTRPYLYKNERVKFRIEMDQEGRRPKAANLKFENGKLVPLFRKNYHQSTIQGEHKRVGEFLLKLMREEGLDDVERMERIKAAVAATEEAIAVAERNQLLYGPTPESDGEE